MLRGERPVTEKTVHAIHSMQGYTHWFDANATKGSKVGAVAGLSPSPSPGAPVVNVPILANAASMGTGTEQHHEDVIIGVLPLSETWMRRTLQPTSVKHVRFIHAYGDSMSPTFEDGDIVLVDTGMLDARAIDGIYVIEANERLYIKRVRQRIDGEVEVSSDNPTVKTVDILNGDHPAMILGKVIYRWLGKKL
ncbi:helix-turn-helix transcriptional regulator [Diaphorobacter sp. HDW4A]|nr:helix-turn-helix transcriptional regulator [Diaphorobacter sp. HDW4A]